MKKMLLTLLVILACSIGIGASAEDGYQKGAMFQFGVVPAETANDMCGYMTAEGRWIIEPVFENALPFGPNGCAFVRTSEGWRCIDLQGEFVTDQVYTYVMHSFAACGIAQVGVRDENGKEKEAFLRLGEDGPVLKYLSDFGENASCASGFTDEGYAVIRDLLTNDCGLINADFEWAVEQREGLNLSHAGVHQGLIAACDDQADVKGYIDTQGNWAITLDYDPTDYRYTAFNEAGLAFDGDWVRDLQGNEVANFRNFGDDVMNDLTESEWICFFDETRGGSGSGSYNYYDLNCQMRATLSSHDDLYWMGKCPMMVADRMLIVETCIFDENGKIIGIDPEGSGDEYHVFVTADGEFVYAVYNVCAGEVDSYYTDGYTWTRDKEDGEYIVTILDLNGNIVFQTSPEMPVDKLNTGRWD